MKVFECSCATTVGRVVNDGFSGVQLPCLQGPRAVRFCCINMHDGRATPRTPLLDVWQHGQQLCLRIMTDKQVEKSDSSCIFEEP